MRRAAAFLILFLLTGCVVGPDYRRPPVDVPVSWIVEENEARDVVNTRWWEQFGDPVLERLITEALEKNKDFRIATVRVEEFLGRYGTVRAGLFPQAGVTGTMVRRGVTEVSNPPFPRTADNPFTDYQTFISASWEIDMWGRIRRLTEAARADLTATEEGRRGVIMTVVAAVAIAYTDLRGLDTQLEIAEGTAKLREESFKLFKLRFDHGLISQLELRQVESEYQSALATIPFLQRLIAEQEHALSLLIGRNPGPISRGKSLNRLTLPAVPAGLPSDLLERRPDIRQAEQNLIAANARIGAAKAAYFPAVSLTGLYGVESVDLARLFTRPARFWNYASPVTLPVFNGGAREGLLETARALEQQALIRYQQVIQQAFREVEDGLIDQAKLREQLKIQGRQVEALRTYAVLARLRYSNGYTSYLEVLDAERGLFNGELSYAQTEGALFRALVNLYKAMGGGWVTAAESISAVAGTGVETAPSNE